MEQPQCCFWQRLLIDLSSGQLACCKWLSICPKIAKIPAVKVSEIVHNDQWEETVWTAPQTVRQLQLCVESFGRQVRSSSDTHPLFPPAFLHCTHFALPSHCALVRMVAHNCLWVVSRNLDGLLKSLNTALCVCVCGVFGCCERLTVSYAVL